VGIATSSLISERRESRPDIGDLRQPATFELLETEKFRFIV